jgi:hypothetical protein
MSSRSTKRKVLGGRAAIVTRESVETLLRRGSQSAQELREALERSHLAGYSRVMSTRVR